MDAFVDLTDAVKGIWGWNVFVGMIVIGWVLGEIVCWGHIRLYERLMRWKEEETLTCGDQVIVHSTGVFERTMYIVLLVTDVTAAAAFIGTFIVGKTILLWGGMQPGNRAVTGGKGGNTPKMAARRASISLQGSLISAGMAVLGALAWNPSAFQ